MKSAILTLALIGVSTVAFARTVGEVSVKFNLVGPNDKIVVESLKDPKIEGIVCHWSKVTLGGISGAMGMATDPSDASLACRQIGPIRFVERFSKQENIAKESRNFFSFKTMQVVRMCDAESNVLIYLVYSDKIIDGSPKNSVSSVPIQPWGDKSAVKCGDNIK